MNNEYQNLLEALEGLTMTAERLSGVVSSKRNEATLRRYRMKVESMQQILSNWVEQNEA